MNPERQRHGRRATSPSSIATSHDAADDDLESQSSRAGLPYSLDKQHAAMFENRYGRRPVWHAMANRHPHPFAAYERSSLEARAFEILWQEMAANAVPATHKVGNVGAACRPHARDGRVHNIVPILHDGDGQRRREFPAGTSVCGHTFQECRCVPYYAYVFTHSLYYIPTADVAARLLECSSGSALAVVHHFDKGFGSLCSGDLVYRYVGHDIRVEARGNNKVYVHPTPITQRPLSARIIPFTDRTGYVQLDCEVVEVMGDTLLVRVSAHPVEKDPPPLPTIRSVRELVTSSSAVEGSVLIPNFVSRQRELNAPAEVVNMGLWHLTGIGPVVVATGTTEEVMVPRGMVAHLATRAAGKPRDPDLWKALIHSASALMHEAVVPPDEKHKTVITAVAIAMMDTSFETDVLYTMQDKFSTAFKLHATLLAGLPVRVVTYWTLLLALLAATLTAVLVYFGLPWHDHIAEAVAVPILAIILIALSCLFCVARYRDRERAAVWRSEATNGNGWPLAPGSGISVGKIAIPATEALRQPLLGDALDAAYRDAGYQRPPILHPGTDENTRLRTGPPAYHQLEGVAPDGPVPSVFNPTARAEVVGVTTRVLNPVPIEQASLRLLTKTREFLCSRFGADSTTTAWVLVGHVAGRLPRGTRYAAPEPPPTPVTSDGASLLALYQATLVNATSDFPRHEEIIPDESYKRWRLRFPENVRKTFDEARRATHGYFPTHRDGRKKSFIKLELLISGGDKPRIISGPLDWVKVWAGPFIWTVQAYFQKAWDGVASPICYASGKTTDALGQVAYDFVQRCGGVGEVICLSDDFSAYDSCLGLASGDLDTNLSGSIINAICHESLPGLTAVPHLMFVNGDDCALFMRRRDWSESFGQQLKEHLRAFGLKPTGDWKVDHHKWEFCSKLWWPAIHPVTRADTWVLGAKPARFMVKSGWTMQTPNATNLFSKMKGAHQDNHHVPFVGAVSAMVLSHVKDRRTVRSKEHDFHSSRQFLPSPDGDRLFEERYGLNAAAWVDIVREHLRVHGLKSVVGLPGFNDAVAIDNE